MNRKQIVFLVVMVWAALVVPAYAAGMFFLGMAVGGFITIMLSSR